MNLSRQINVKYNLIKEKLFADVTPDQRELLNAVMRTMLKNVQK